MRREVILMKRNDKTGMTAEELMWDLERIFEEFDDCVEPCVGHEAEARALKTEFMACVEAIERIIMTDNDGTAPPTED